MNQDDPRMPAKYRGGKITSGFVITAAALLIFVLFMLIMMKLGVVEMPAVFRLVFGEAERVEQTEPVSGDVLPDFAADVSGSTDHYYSFSIDPRETLALLAEWDSYVREFRVINWYGEDADSRKYTLTVKGDCFRLESDSKVVVCDGQTTCTVTGTYRTTLDGSVFTLENEIGITPLSEIKAAAEKGSVTYPASEEKHLLIVTEDAESGILSEYLVSIETGVVMSERSYRNGTLYRAVVTDAVDVFGADDLPADYFAIPMEP